MAKPFDTTLKHLLEAYPQDWLKLVGIPSSADVKIVDADLATVTAETDKLLLIESDTPWLANLELQSSYKGDVPDRLLFGGTLAGRRHGLPVQSVAILLRPEADGPAMTGKLIRRHPPGRDYLEFHYDVVRLWQLPVEAFLSGGLGILPLATLALGAERRLEQIVDQIQEQAGSLSDSSEQGSLLASAFVLMGLRYSRETAEALFRRIRTMEESVTYQAIIEKGFAKGFSLGITEGRVEGREEGREEGRLETARDILVKVGTKRFGPPSAMILESIEKISDYQRLERLTEELIDSESWEQVLKD